MPNTNLIQLKGVDIMKFIMSFAVVAIHVQATGGEFPLVIQWFIRLAVPFFFITSGYLLSRKLDNAGESSDKFQMLIHRGKHVFKLFSIWVLIYVPIAVSYCLISGESVIHMIVTNTYSLVFQGEIRCAWPLWFLYSLGIFTLLLAWAIGNRKKMILMAGIICFAYLFYSVVNSSIANIFPDSIVSIIRLTPTRVLGGGIYIFEGMAIYKYSSYFNSVIVSIILLVISFSLYIFGLPFSELPGGLALFEIAFIMPVKITSASGLRLRSQSMWIYYLHMLFVFGLYVLGHFFNITFSLWLNFIIVTITTWILSCILVRLQRYEKCHFLNFLVS